MEKKYKALRFIAVLMKVLALLVAVAAVITAILIFATGVLSGVMAENLGRQLNQSSGGLNLFTGVVGGLVFTFFPLVSGGFLALFFYAVGEAIYVQIDIEANTRTTRENVLALLKFLADQAHFNALQPVHYPAAPLAADSPASLPAYSVCPQCGARVNAASMNCPECGYTFRNEDGLAVRIKPQGIGA